MVQLVGIHVQDTSSQHGEKEGEPSRFDGVGSLTTQLEEATTFLHERRTVDGSVLWKGPG